MLTRRFFLIILPPISTLPSLPDPVSRNLKSPDDSYLRSGWESQVRDKYKYLLNNKRSPIPSSLSPCKPLSHCVRLLNMKLLLRPLR